jgi:hypothetical protein
LEKPVGQKDMQLVTLMGKVDRFDSISPSPRQPVASIEAFDNSCEKFSPVLKTLSEKNLKEFDLL